MQPRVNTATSYAVSRTSERIAELALDLGIAGFQQAAWDVFVETLIAVVDALASVAEMGPHNDGQPPSLPDFIRCQKARLAAELEAAGILTASVDNLYRALSLRQRTRADRLLEPFLGSLVRGSDPAWCAIH